MRPAAGLRSGSRLGILTRDSLIRFDWEVAIGGEAGQTLTRAEFEALAAAKEPLVQVRGQWVELHPGEVARALACFDRRPASGEISLTEALSLALAPGAPGGAPALPPDAAGGAGPDGPLPPQVRVDAGADLGALLTELTGPPAPGAGAAPDAVPDAEPPGFVGELRPYQRRASPGWPPCSGYGLGACLADDMGLGKTIHADRAAAPHRRRAPRRRGRADQTAAGPMRDRPDAAGLPHLGGRQLAA